MKKIKIIIFLLIFFLTFWALAKTPIVVREAKPVQAVRSNEEIKIDGQLDEKIWQREGRSEFFQSDPKDGVQPTEKTTVWVAYDDKALYVAAFLYDTDTSKITKRLGRRDDFVDSDWFLFSVDPYFDRRTGYCFAINPSDSIYDSVLYNDTWEDSSWDGVWEARTMINGQGWTVEMKIPYHQLRFHKKDEYVWGVNFRRIIKRKNERINYVWIPKEENGFVSRFARLEGIRGITPGRHIEVIPYTVGQGQFRPAEEGNPFEKGSKFLGNAGLDLKIGLKSNLTLDASFNPDFGQVEVDPAVINLSAYETYYQEKRPFFIEGSSLFNGFGSGGSSMGMNINWPSPSFFYSRRIGRAPQGEVSQEGFVNIPDRTTILGAAKLTGKLGGDWNFTFLNSLTAREYADIDFNGNRLAEEVEPFSYYGVLRAQKEFHKGQQGLGFMATGVLRNLKKETLQDILNKNAFSLALDGWTYLDKKRTWVFTGWFGGTRVEGSPEDILRLQKSSMHYFQRPDAGYLKLDPTATSLSGWGGRFSLSKEQGRFIFHTALGVLSPGFDPNDLGFQYGSSDRINAHMIFAYQWPHPGKVFRNAMIFAGPFVNYDFGGDKTWEGALADFNFQFLNYWGAEVMLAYNPKTISNTLTRGGPLALIPAGHQVNLNISSDNRKPIVIFGYSSYYRRPNESFSLDNQVSLRWKPRQNLDFSFGPGYSLNSSQTQWVRRVSDPLMTDTFGNRYVFGRIDQKTIFGEIRLNWIFTPRLSLQLYLQPFISVGRYDLFKELSRPKTHQYNTYGEGASAITFEGGTYTVDPDGSGPATAFSFANPDFNFKSMRGTAVLRWEFRPGSLLYFVWTQNRADYAHPGELRLGRDFGDLLTAPGDNIFMVKFTYRFNI